LPRRFLGRFSLRASHRFSLYWHFLFYFSTRQDRTETSHVRKTFYTKIYCNKWVLWFLWLLVQSAWFQFIITYYLLLDYCLLLIYVASSWTATG
jgi:hypothetical protein